MNVQVAEAVKKVDEAAAVEDVRVFKTMKPKQAIQQGDVYVHRVADDYPVGKCLSKGDTQVAEGTSLGARHYACGEITVYETPEKPSWFEVPQRLEWQQMVGPTIEAKKGWELRHPEHANFKLPAGKYVVSYQYDPRTMRRTID